MEKLTQVDANSHDLVAENIDKLKAIFPEAVTEGKIDFEVLKEALGEYLESREERYNFSWAGKSKARRLAQTSTTGTLRPCPKESLDWETTKNLFIEGDNLEVLKLLQKSYQGQVKMIYIDPPYNTGGDFVYPDKYADNLKGYLEYTNQVDAEGNKQSTNTESSGRYHSNWLNMMLPRLQLAKNLLKSEGVAFISIDDIELSNLKKLCDEVFGEENHIGIFCRKTKSGGGSASDSCAVEHDYVLAFAKSSSECAPLKTAFEQKYLSRYKEEDDISPYFWDTMERSSTATKPYLIEAPDGTMLKGKWFRSEATFKDDLEKGEVRFLKKENGWSVQFKQRLADGKKLRTILETSDLTQKEFRSLNAELEDIIGTNFGHPPKPVKLMETLVDSCTESDDIILDFFAGSCSTAHATLGLNLRDKSERRFIMVQIPEKTKADSDALNAGFETVVEIGKERIRRASAKIKEEHPNYTGDLGFKVFKLDSSNIETWDSNVENLEDNVLKAANVLKDDRNKLDIVYELLLKYGLDLSYPVNTHEVACKKVYEIGAGSLFICLEDGITNEFIEALIRLYKTFDGEAAPRVVFKDSGFKNDATKKDAESTLKDAGILDVKCL